MRESLLSNISGIAPCRVALNQPSTTFTAEAAFPAFENLLGQVVLTNLAVNPLAPVLADLHA